MSGKGLQELLYYVRELLDSLPDEPVVFEQEYFPEELNIDENLPYTVEKSQEEENTYVVEGPKIEKMLGYTNLESEKGFAFFQRFLKETGILDELEAAGIQEEIPSACMVWCLTIISKRQKYQTVRDRGKRRRDDK